jgi:hypothetical protein
VRLLELTFLLAASTDSYVRAWSFLLSAICRKMTDERIAQEMLVS